MGYNTITVTTNNFVTIITLNRPPTNSINLGMREDLDRAITELEQSRDTRIIIITGAGDKGFCAGMDVSDVANLYNGPDAIDMFNRIDRFPKPLIAAVNGYCLGGGCELALACHFRFMTDNPKAKIGCPELNLGITPGWGGIQRMARLLGRSTALDLILFSRRLSAQEALAVGLVDRVFPAAEFMKETSAFAQALAKRPPVAVNAVLDGMITGIEKGIDEGIRVDRVWSKKCEQTKDAHEGFTAFMQKREPVFTGE
ncbi:MAG: enoyl-CoA hydratase [Spirochaetes bacterium RBG_13_51_14]|nr:MAG: enoyl-CoA hydratase [Spirochaetes bacterium RBG_13_51_14]